MLSYACRRLSLQPKQSPSSRRSLKLTEGVLEPRLNTRTQIPGEVAWCCSSHDLSAEAEGNVMMGRSVGGEPALFFD